MKHKLLFFSFCTLLFSSAYSQTDDKPHIYDPNANAQQDIKNAVSLAAKEHKHVFVQVGGNWCIWCVRFNNLVTTDTELNHLLHDNYVIVHVNYSPENKNEKVLAQLGYPQRFGYPVFVILNAKGNVIHIQNSGYLEEGKGHSPKKVAEFLKQWSPAALDPRTYAK